jgi:hypothetical protein
MGRHLLKRAWIILILFAVSAVPSFGADLGAIKERMKERLPTVKMLKVKGVVGENNEGYLEFLGSERQKASVVAAENEDRRKVYQAIADQQNVGLGVVERHRAAQIRDEADSGIWLEDAKGNWYQQQ